MNEVIEITYADNKAIAAKKAQFLCVDVVVKDIIESWRDSVFSFEWLRPDGSIKDLKELAANEAQKRLRVEQKIQSGEALEKPVLGIGLMDNVEIGAGRAELLTLASRGIKLIPVHIPKSNESDFKAFRADIS